MAFVQCMRYATRNIHIGAATSCKFRLPKEAVDEFENVADAYQSLPVIPDQGKICAKLPFKIKVKKGKTYMWCSCGHSNSQPMCDNTHAMTQMRIKMQPVRFISSEDRDVWFCMCKRTKHRPFCDGSHKDEEVQAAFKW